MIEVMTTSPAAATVRPSLPVTLLPAAAYTLGLAAVAVALASRGPAGKLRWLAWASTNLDNLSDHPAAAMIASAFLTTGTVIGWLLLAFVGLAAAAAALGPLRAALLVIAVHVFATLVSEGLLALRIHAG